MSHELFGLNVVIWQFDHLSKPSFLGFCAGVFGKKLVGQDGDILCLKMCIYVLMMLTIDHGSS
jgi:hypothetical protein